MKYIGILISLFVNSFRREFVKVLLPGLSRAAAGAIGDPPEQMLPTYSTK